MTDPNKNQASKENEVEILVFGEVLYDCFPDGRRILGGAPFNVAWGLQGFGHAPHMISAVGADADGIAVRSRMEAWGMNTIGLQTDAEHGTGIVEVTVRDGEPTYEISAPRAWDFILDPGISNPGMLYHGTLALRGERSRKTFEALRSRSDAPRFFDVNLRPPHTPVSLVRDLLPGAAWVKMNLDELGEVVGEDGLTLDGSDAVIDAFLAEYEVGTLLLTAGAQGAKLRGAYGNATVSPAPAPKKIVDTVGAGDAFSAVTLSGILRNRDAGKIIEDAAKFAAKICGLRGATSDEAAFYVL
ncbi:MAG: carbohydrate kinase [Verrucomicrobia bacterium]|nr:carbohydrate kinase [Verrucomicrobiota bacterium]MCH8510418.1 PfkB family carbohydrate kinase [Kiritimatiellia bacterium]